MLNRLWRFAIGLQIWKDDRGQDLLEYALVVSFLVVSSSALVPGIAAGISTVFSKVASTATAAASQS